jgi:hypothetical protein
MKAFPAQQLLYQIHGSRREFVLHLRDRGGGDENTQPIAARLQGLQILDQIAAGSSGSPVAFELLKGRTRADLVEVACEFSSVGDSRTERTQFELSGDFRLADGHTDQQKGQR